MTQIFAGLSFKRTKGLTILWEKFRVSCCVLVVTGIHSYFCKADIIFFSFAHLVFPFQIGQVKQELSRKDTELLALQTKLETLTNQFSDSKQHIEVLKESLTAKEQRAAILQTEVKWAILC